MTVLKMLALIAAVLFLGFAFFKLGRFIVREWRKIEKEEEELRQARLRAITRSGELNQVTGSGNRLKT